MKKGLFITFEGPDGSGKTTQIELLKSYLASKGYEAVLTREPGGTKISENIRELILDKDNVEMNDITETLLYAASRAQHVAEVIKPALSNGKMVICDRFMDSSIVYQGYGRQLGQIVRDINEVAVDGTMPHITFLMKVNPAIGKKRIENENLDRLERESIEFHNRVYNGYLQLEKDFPERIIAIDGLKTIEEIHDNIVTHIDKIIKRELLC